MSELKASFAAAEREHRKALAVLTPLEAAISSCAAQLEAAVEKIRTGSALQLDDIDTLAKREREQVSAPSLPSLPPFLPSPKHPLGLAAHCRFALSSTTTAGCNHPPYPVHIHPPDATSEPLPTVPRFAGPVLPLEWCRACCAHGCGVRARAGFPPPPQEPLMRATEARLAETRAIAARYSTQREHALQVGACACFAPPHASSIRALFFRAPTVPTTSC